MKEVYLVRHAQAGIRGSSSTDFDRPLEPQGIEEAKVIAKRFLRNRPVPELLISSPAKRALQTAEIFAKKMEIPAEEIALKDILYGESNAELLAQLVNKTEEAVSSIMLFGHDPLLSEAAAFLALEFHEALPKCAVIGLRFEAENWREISSRSGSVFYYDYPLNKNAKAKLEKSARREIASLIATIVSDTFRNIDQAGAERVKGEVKKSSLKLAEKFLEAAKGSNTVFRRWAPEYRESTKPEDSEVAKT